MVNKHTSLSIYVLFDCGIPIKNENLVKTKHLMYGTCKKCIILMYIHTSIFCPYDFTLYYSYYKSKPHRVSHPHPFIARRIVCVSILISAAIPSTPLGVHVTSQPSTVPLLSLSPTELTQMIVCSSRLTNMLLFSAPTHGGR